MVVYGAEALEVESRLSIAQNHMASGGQASE
jgi:hypothetical protein